MKLPTQEYLKELFHYDPETGVFTRKINRGKAKVGDIAGTFSTTNDKNNNSLPKTYRSIGIDFKMYREHRLAWVYMTGSAPKEEIDHIDGDGTNNKWSNLREATRSQNGMNRKVKHSTKSGYRGIWIRKNGNFAAEIIINKKKVGLGCYKTLQEARAAYKAAAKLHFGIYANPS